MPSLAAQSPIDQCSMQTVIFLYELARAWAKSSRTWVLLLLDQVLHDLVQVVSLRHLTFAASRFYVDSCQKDDDHTHRATMSGQSADRFIFNSLFL